MVTRNNIQIGTEIFNIYERFPVHPQLQENILHNFFALCFRAAKVQYISSEFIGIEVKEFAEGSFIAFRNPQQQRLFIICKGGHHGYKIRKKGMRPFILSSIGEERYVIYLLQ